MSVGNIVVTLELKDGQFKAGMRNAGKTIRILDGDLDNLDKRVKRVEKGLVGFVPRLRDIAVVAASAHVVIRSLSDTVVAFTGNVIKSNAEIERMSALLSGISNAPTESGRLKNAADDIAYLFDMAQRAPFSINELSNSFVKMKAAGIEDVDSKIVSLTDAIARFGGDEQTLHRATIAIQQMASKGVVSMEELRQQLGESVPNAMQLMADGVGMSMADMVKAISEGRVKAIPAIDEMMDEMNKRMSGASERMMETWNGMMSQLSTRWILLQKEMGDEGFFTAAKEALGDLNEFLDSDEALQMAAIVGTSLRDVTLALVDTVKVVSQYSSEIATGVATTVKLYLAIKSLMIGRSVFQSVTASYNTFIAAMAASRTVIISTTTAADFMNGKITAGMATSTVQTMGWARALGYARAGVTALGGPISVTIAGLSLLAATWDLWGNSASDAYEKVAQSRDKLLDGGASLRLFTRESIQEAQADIDAVAAEIEEKSKQLADIKASIERQDGALGGAKGGRNSRVAQAEKIAREILALETKNAEARKNLEADVTELVEREANRKATAAERSIRKELAAFSQGYTERMDIARKARDAILEGGKFNADQERAANEAFREAERENTILFYSGQQELLKNSIEKMKETLVDVDHADTSIRLIDASETEQALLKSKVKITETIASLRAEIEAGASVGEDVILKKEELKKEEKALADLEVRMQSVSLTIRWLMGINGGEDVMQTAANIAKLRKFEEMFNQVSEMLSKARSGQRVPVLNDVGVDAKNATTALGKLKTTVESIRDRNAGLQDAVAGGSSSIGRMVAKVERLAQAAGASTEEVKKLKKEALALLGENRGLEATTEVMKKIDEMQGKVDRLKAKINDGDPDATFIAKVREDFKKGLIDPKVFSELERVNSELREQNAIRKAQKGLDFLAEQGARISADLSLARAKASRDAAETEKYLVQERIDDLTRLANAQKDNLTQEQKDAFVREGAAAFRHEREIIAAAETADRIRSINEQTQREKINLIYDAGLREKALLDQNHADRVRLAKEQIADEGQRLAAIGAYEKLRLASITRIEEANKSSFEKLLDTYTRVSEKMELISARFVDGFTDGLADMVTNGKFSFADFANSVLNDIARMVIKAASADLIKTVFGIDSKSAGGGLSDLLKGGEGGGYPWKHLTSAFLSGDRDNEGGANIAPSTNAFQSIAAGITPSFSATVETPESVTQAVTEGWEDLSTSVDGIFKSEVPDLMDGVEDAFGEDFGSLTDSMDTTLTDGFDGLLSSLGSIFKDIGSAVGSLFGGGGGGAAASTAGTVVAALFAKGGTMGADYVSDDDMQKGGVATSAKMAVFGEASIPEAFIPMQDRRNVAVTLTDFDGRNATAEIPLPSGKKIPTKVTVADNVGARMFAQGGIMGDTKLPSSLGLPYGNTGSLSLLGDMTSILSSIDKKMDAISMLDKLPAVGGVGMSVPDMSKIDSYDARDKASTLNSTLRDSPNNVGGDVSISITVNGSQEGKNVSGANGSAQEGWNEVAERVKTIVKQEIATQQRPGGNLYRD